MVTFGICEGCQAIELAKQEAEEQATAQRKREDRIRSALPKRYQWARFDAPELRQRVRSHKAITLAQKAVEASLPIVTFTGAAGDGKTVLAACCAAARVMASKAGRYDNAISVTWVTGLDLARARCASKLGDEEHSTITDARTAHVLVLDDLGQEQSSEFIASTIREVVWDRYDEERPTIITTGLTLEQVATRYGDGMARRLFEAGEIHVGGK